MKTKVMLFAWLRGLLVFATSTTNTSASAAAAAASG